ncbi:unnamed protein product [Linum trigynum]|uniref:Uncharacterized protein n=1 Tax=Linum trigynum TaxID=586398 RepID=A0AAV2CWS0_9ROSI
MEPGVAVSMLRSQSMINTEPPKSTNASINDEGLKQLLECSKHPRWSRKPMKGTLRSCKKDLESSMLRSQSMINTEPPKSTNASINDKGLKQLLECSKHPRWSRKPMKGTLRSCKKDLESSRRRGPWRGRLSKGYPI